ncbi:MAG TPA: hypothetical protein PLA83_02655 [Deltaproteobacteria bacterium]|jgi:hypothetical protein|nr:hypothetical protein [Deltaproteobacteria bacterium]HQI01694.1 hypothetical protein [Deltaproteobacteria bacterium]
MGIIKDLARQGKDRAVSKTLTALGDQYLSRYGKIIDIRLDSHDRRIEIEMLLKGEPEPVSVRLEDYGIISEGQRRYITCREIHVSKEWMKALANDLIRDRKFEIPSKYARLLDLIIQPLAS